MPLFIYLSNCFARVSFEIFQNYILLKHHNMFGNDGGNQMAQEMNLH